MHISDYLFRHGLSPEDLREFLGLHRSTIHRICTGERRPSLPVIRRIQDFTHGEVTASDFVELKPPECAIVEHRDGRSPSVILPFKTRNKRLDTAFALMQREPTEIDKPCWQEQRAFQVLGPRVRRAPKNVYFLDDSPTDLRRLIEEANRILVRRGDKPIRYPLACPIWRRARSSRHTGPKKRLRP